MEGRCLPMHPRSGNSSLSRRCDGIRIDTDHSHRRLDPRYPPRSRSASRDAHTRTYQLPWPVGRKLQSSRCCPRNLVRCRSLLDSARGLEAYLPILKICLTVPTTTTRPRIHHKFLGSTGTLELRPNRPRKLIIVRVLSIARLLNLLRAEGTRGSRRRCEWSYRSEFRTPPGTAIRIALTVGASENNRPLHF